MIIVLINDLRQLGDRLYSIRKRRGMTQAQVAEAADVSDRTYTEIERGIVNMRILTCVKICEALHITPDEVLVEAHEQLSARENTILDRLHACPLHQKETALRLLEIYLDSVET